MNFLHPILLAAGLAAISIPILIHILMRRRRRPVQFAAMRFLIEAYKKQRRRLQLEQLLLLALRCLIVACLAIAIAQPLLGSTGTVGTRATTLYLIIDNAITAAARTEGNETALEQHKETALAALTELDPTRADRVALITTAAPAEAIILPPTGDLTAARRAIEALEPTDSAADPRGALALLATNLATESQNEANASDNIALLLSESRAGSTDLDRAPITIPQSANQPLNLIVAAPAEDNLSDYAVASVEPARAVLLADEAAGAGGQLRVRVTRQGPAVNQPATLEARLIAEATDTDAANPSRNERTVSATTVTFAPGEAESITRLTVPTDLIAPPNAQRAASARRVFRIEIAPTEPTADTLDRNNAARVTLELRTAARVGLIARPRFGSPVGVADFRPADWLKLALSPLDEETTSDAVTLELTEISPQAVDTPRLIGLDAVIVLRPEQLDQGAWRRLADFATAGGLVIAIPSEEPGTQQWPARMAEAFNTDFRIAAEPTTFETPRALNAEPANRPGSLLSLLAGELNFLVEPVRVTQAFALESPGRENPVTTEIALAPANTTGNTAADPDAQTQPLIISFRPNPDSNRGLAVVALTAFDLAWSDLPAKPLFVPLAQELVRQGVAAGASPRLIVAGATPTADTAARELIGVTGESRGDRLRLGTESSTPIRNAGVWRVIDAQGEDQGLLTVNPDAEAARLAPTDRERLNTWYTTALSGEAPSFLDESNQAARETPLREALGSTNADAGGSPSGWPWLLAAIALAVLESPLARLASHATRTATRTGLGNASTQTTPGFGPRARNTTNAPDAGAAA